MEQSPAALSALGRWLWERRLSDRDFAAMMAKHLKTKRFSRRTVEKWRYGERVPESKNMRAIKALTGITADDMLMEASRADDQSLRSPVVPAGTGNG